MTANMTAGYAATSQNSPIRTKPPEHCLTICKNSTMDGNWNFYALSQCLAFYASISGRTGQADLHAKNP